MFVCVARASLTFRIIRPFLGPFPFPHLLLLFRLSLFFRFGSLLKNCARCSFFVILYVYNTPSVALEDDWWRRGDHRAAKPETHTLPFMMVFVIFSHTSSPKKQLRQRAVYVKFIVFLGRWLAWNGSGLYWCSSSSCVLPKSICYVIFPRWDLLVFLNAIEEYKAGPWWWWWFGLEWRGNTSERGFVADD